MRYGCLHFHFIADAQNEHSHKPHSYKSLECVILEDVTKERRSSRVESRVVLR
jgi:hypothetical protein